MFKSVCVSLVVSLIVVFGRAVIEPDAQLVSARKPLVLVGGQAQVLADTDYLSVPGGITTNGSVAAAGDLQVTTINGVAPTAGSTVVWFGNGEDGNVTLSGVTTLTRNMAYNNVTLNSGASIDAAGFLIEIAGTLTGDATNRIHHDGLPGTTAANDTTAGVGGTAYAQAGRYLGVGTSGSNGNTSTNGGSTTAQNTPSVRPMIVGASATGVPGTGIAHNGETGSSACRGGGGAAAGGGGTGAPGGAITANASPAVGEISDFLSLLDGRSPRTSISAPGFVNPWPAGTGGGGGATSGFNSGAGGGGGAGAGWLVVRVKTISGAIDFSARGGAGGNGAPDVSNGAGGGGGGGGGGVCLIATTTSPIPTCVVTGGAGGLGFATGGNTGYAGDGGAGAAGLSYSLQL